MWWQGNFGGFLVSNNHVLSSRITSAAADETERGHVVGRRILPDRRREFPQNYVWIWSARHEFDKAVLLGAFDDGEQKSKIDRHAGYF